MEKLQLNSKDELIFVKSSSVDDKKSKEEKSKSKGFMSMLMSFG